METCHSEYGAIRSICLKPAEKAFVNQQQISEQWESLNYLGKPDFKNSIIEYDHFEKIIQETGADINYFPENKSVHIDSIYCRDASIFTDFGAILCNMGKKERKNESSAAHSFYEEIGQDILGVIKAPGTLEGGDVAWLDDVTLAVGRTYRTNDEGIEQLRGLLEPKDIRIVQVDLPHYKGPSDVFHLMSILSPVDKDLAVIYSPLMPINFRTLLLDMNYKLVEVPEKEFDSMGCNVLALGPRDCLMVEGARVRTYKGSEISVKGGGGPTCLSRPILREI